MTNTAQDQMECLPIIHDLDCEPTREELSKVISTMAAEKASGSDGIPPDLLRQCKTCLLPLLHDILIKCWRKGEVPQDMRDAKIITLYKNKGARSDCNNHRGISLLSIVGKTFARVLLPRLQTFTGRIHPESQCGFRSKLSTMIFLCVNYKRLRGAYGSIFISLHGL